MKLNFKINIHSFAMNFKHLSFSLDVIHNFFMEELDLSEEERFKKHCVGCCCGDGCECNKHSWDNCCDNWEDGSEPLQG